MCYLTFYVYGDPLRPGRFWSYWRGSYRFVVAGWILILLWSSDLDHRVCGFSRLRAVLIGGAVCSQEALDLRWN